MKIKIEVETHVYTTDHADPDDSWSRDSTAGYITNVTARRVKEDTEVRESWYGDSIYELDMENSETVYAVVVDYESGDTFGRSGGHYQIVDAFNNMEDAEALYDLVVAYDVNSSKRIRTDSLTYKGKHYYAGWTGYFESTQSIDIWTCPVIIAGKTRSYKGSH